MKSAIADSSIISSCSFPPRVTMGVRALIEKEHVGRNAARFGFDDAVPDRYVMIHFEACDPYLRAI